MRTLQLSSGDLVADRRASYAAALAEELDFAAAADLMVQVLELTQDWIAGWHLLGQYREEAGDIEGAIAAWDRVQALDKLGVFGAALKLAAYGRGTPEPVTRYVEALFDDYAPRFEDQLLGALGYRTPEELGALIRQAGGGGVVLDLGCGTGLMGQELRNCASRLDGVDLSEAMLAEAARKGIYDRLEQGDLMLHLGAARDIDLIAAADVLNYVGALPPVLSAALVALRPGGLFAFSLETQNGPEPLVVQPSLRFAHAPDAALAEVVASGFTLVASRETVLRQDRGVDVPGLLVVAQRPV